MAPLQHAVNRTIYMHDLVNISVDDLIKHLNRCLKKFGVKVRHHKIEVEYFSITASYDFNKDKIQLYVCCNPDFRLIEPDYDEFKFEISASIQHEYIHKEQYSRNREDQDCWMGGVSTSTDSEYYASPAEIQAFAHDIMLQISFHGQPWNIIKDTDLACKYSTYYKDYLDSFGNINHSVMKKLIKHCYKFKDVRWIP